MGDTTHAYEHNLKLLFAEKQRLENELRKVNEGIVWNGKQYWKSLGYSVMPRIERLRAAILG